MKKIVLGLFAVLVFASLAWYARPGENEIPKNNVATSAVGSMESAFSQTQSASGALVSNETNYDFGSISMAAGKVTRAFKIENLTVQDVVIEKIYTSCMCTQASISIAGKTFGPFGMPGHGFFGSMVNQVLKAGESAQVEVMFDPAAHGPAGVGPAERVVFVESKDGSRLQFNIKALVTP